MAEDDVELGYVVDLTLGEPSGTELVADAAIGAPTLTVDYAGDFEDVGEVSLNGATLAYTSIAYGTTETDPDVITLAAPLAAAAVVDDKVVRVSGGEPLSDWLLHVSLGDGHPVDIPIPFEQRALWSSVDTSTPVPVMVSSDLERLVEVPGREPQIDGAFIDPTSTIPGGQAFSLDAPTATDGYPEDYGWWQVDASNNVLGFWRLVGGAWTAQAIVTAEALKANNAIITALTGETITGATIQTRAAADLGIKLGEVKGSTNYDEAFIVFNESGVPFIKAVPAEELAVIAGEVKATTTTVIEGASLGGVTEVTRGPITTENPTGTAGALRLTAGTTAPKSAPTVTTGYDTVQFTNDGNWGARSGWTTDGTSWYTLRATSSSQAKLERWNAAGTLAATEPGTAPSNDRPSGVVYGGGWLWALDYDSRKDIWLVDRYDPATLTTATNGWSEWIHADGSSVPAIGYDSASGEILIAQSRPSDVTVPNRVRVRRYTFNAAGTLTAGASVDTDFGYNADLAGVTYGTHDLGANRYIVTGRGSGQSVFRVTNSTGAEVVAEQWPNAMASGKVGFTYVSRTATVTTANTSVTVTGASGTFGRTDVGSAISGTGIPANAVISAYTSSTTVTISAPATASASITATLSGFKSMDATGLMRTYTGQDKATASSADLTKWVSNTLANATAETEQSPRAKIVLPKRTKLNLTTSTINATGTNSPDRVRIYVGRGSTDPGRTKMERQADPATGVISTSYSSLAAPTGTNLATNPPPATNNFPSGMVQRFELADGTQFIDGAGGGSAWTTYTPTFTAATTNPTLASFTITGRYARLGRNAITFSVVITATTTTGFGSGSYEFGLPVAARTADAIVVTAAQTGPNHTYTGRSSGGSTTVVTLMLNATDVAMNVTNSGMANGTVLRIVGTYEAA